MNYILIEKAIYREKFFSDNFLESNINICKGISVIVVSHLIDTGIPYIKTIDKYFDLQSIIPKQKSINHYLLDYFPKAKILNIAREDINNEPEIIEKILDNRPKGNKIVLLDIGGIFRLLGID